MDSFWFIPVLLTCLVAFFPEDAFLFAQISEAKIKLHVMNIRMFIMAYTMYRRLCHDFRDMGLPVPPFRYVPLWNR